MNDFIVNRPATRIFFLGVPTSPSYGVEISKNTGPFISTQNPLQPLAGGWFMLQLTAADLDTIGPLAYSFPGFNLASGAQDAVIRMPHGHIDQVALQGAFDDLANGWYPSMTLAEMLKRPLFQFLLSLQ